MSERRRKAKQVIRKSGGRTGERRAGANQLVSKSAGPIGLLLAPLRRRNPRDLAEAREDVALLTRNGRICQYLLGDRLAFVRDHELYRQEGLPSMKAFLRTIRSPSERTLYGCMALADSVPGEVVEAYDIEKIEAGVQLLRRRANAGILVTKAGLEAIRVPAERGGKRVEVSFRDASVDELVDAILNRRKKALPEFPADFERGLDRIRGRFGEGVTAIANVRGQRQGSQHVAVITVLDDRLDDFLKLLR